MNTNVKPGRKRMTGFKCEGVGFNRFCGVGSEKGLQRGLFSWFRGFLAAENFGRMLTVRYPELISLIICFFLVFFVVFMVGCDMIYT